MQNKAITKILFILLTISFAAYGQDDWAKNNRNRFFTEAEIKAANTAVNTSYLQPEEQAVYLYANLARMYPQKFNQLVKAYVAQLEPDERDTYTTSEYYQSLLTDLAAQESVHAYYPDKVMFDFASCWAEESGRTGVTGHDRVSCANGPFAENCSYGSNTGFAIILQLLIDQDVSSKGHRHNLLTPFYSSMGVAIKPHKEYGYVTVQDFYHWADWQREQASQMQAEFKKRLTQWSADELKKANACQTLDYLNDYEKEFFFYINLIRINPKKFQMLVWGDKPLFQFNAWDKEAEDQKNERFNKIKAWLMEAESMDPVVPSRMAVAESRCMAKRTIEGREDAESCLKESKGWFISYELPEIYYNDMMNMFVDVDQFIYFCQSSELVLVLEKGPDSFCKLVTY